MWYCGWVDRLWYCGWVSIFCKVSATCTCCPVQNITYILTSSVLIYVIGRIQIGGIVLWLGQYHDIVGNIMILLAIA